MFLARTCYDTQGATVHARYALRCQENKQPDPLLIVKPFPL